MSAFDPAPEELARIDWRRAETWLLGRCWVRRSAGRGWWMERGERVVSLASVASPVNGMAALRVVADAHELDGDALWRVLRAWQEPVAHRRGLVLEGPDGEEVVCLVGADEAGGVLTYAMREGPADKWEVWKAGEIGAPWWMATGAMEVQT